MPDQPGAGEGLPDGRGHGPKTMARAGVITAGAHVEIRTAYDNVKQAVAVSGVEGTHLEGRKIHDFPVIWVTVDGGNGIPIPWPAEDVWLAPWSAWDKEESDADE